MCEGAEIVPIFVANVHKLLEKSVVGVDAGGGIAEHDIECAQVVRDVGVAHITVGKTVKITQSAVLGELGVVEDVGYGKPVQAVLGLIVEKRIQYQHVDPLVQKISRIAYSHKVDHQIAVFEFLGVGGIEILFGRESVGICQTGIGKIHIVVFEVFLCLKKQRIGQGEHGEIDAPLVVENHRFVRLSVDADALVNVGAS